MRKVLSFIFISYFATIGFVIAPNAIAISNPDETIIRPSDLKDGDIIFWKDSKQQDRAGHVAVLNRAGLDKQILRIVHSTDNPKYNAFVETNMLPSEKLQQNNKYYFVIRVKDMNIRSNFIDILRAWLPKKIPFNSATELLMNKWDDSMDSYSTAFKVKLQNMLFEQGHIMADNIPKEGYMCSELIILALQKSFRLTTSYKLPLSLQLDPILCPPSTFMFAIENDHANFEVMGSLTVPINGKSARINDSGVFKQ